MINCKSCNLFSIKFKISLLVFVMFFATVTAQASSTAFIEGQVLNGDTGDPIAGANVILEGTQIGSSTDLDGGFQLNRLPHGDLRLIISYVGYESKVIDISLNKGDHKDIEVELTPTSFVLDPVVVTGTMSKRYIQDAPIRTEVISSRDLDLRSAANIYEALETAPGVRVEEQCQSCNFSQIRMNGLGSDHTQILLDGQPVYSGLASIYGLQQFSTSEIDRIEIIKGSGSALYGSSAIAGAVNIITERPSVDKIEAGIEVGEYGTNQFSASAAMVRDNSALHLFAQLNEEDAIDETQDGLDRDAVLGKDGVTDRVESNTRNVGANIYFDDVIRPDDEVFLRFRYLNENRIGGETIDDSYRNPFNAGTEHISTNRLTGALGYRLQLSEIDAFEIEITGVQHERNATNDTYLGDYMDTHDGDVPDVDNMRPYLANEEMYLVNSHYSRKIASHNLMAGFQYSYDELEETGKYVIVEEDDPQYGLDYTSIANKHAHDLGIFIQDEWRPVKNFEIVAGVRNDIHKSEDTFKAVDGTFSQVFESSEYDETSVNPRLAIKWSPRWDWTFRLNVGTGYKVPYGFSEDLHLCSGSPRVWKGSSLKPESSQSLNLSADYSVSRFAFGINGFYTELVDAIGIVNANAQARAKGYHYAYQNIDDATIFGLDFNARYQVLSNLQILGDVSYFNGEYDSIREDWAGTQYENDSKKISRYPALSGGLRLDWSPGKWETTVDAQYTGNMFIDYAEEDDLENPGSQIFETDPYVIFNSQVSYKFTKNYRCYVGARNLGDYVQPVKHTDDAAFFYAPVYGRIFYSGIRVQF